MLSPTVLGFLGTPAHKSEVPLILVQNWLLLQFLNEDSTLTGYLGLSFLKGISRLCTYVIVYLLLCTTVLLSFLRT